MTIRFGGIYRAGGEHQLFRLGEAYGFRKEIEAAAIGGEPYVGKALDEADALGGICEIAGQGQIESGPGGHPVYHGDDGL